MPLSGRVECIDFCIHQIVAALNAGGVRTVGSCCGHGPGFRFRGDGGSRRASPNRPRRRRCGEAGVRPPMGSVGDCYDNAMCESFFATLECELIDRSCFHTHAVARMELFDYIEGWYNPHRRHSAIDYESPMNFEHQHTADWATPLFDNEPHARRTLSRRSLQRA